MKWVWKPFTSSSPPFFTLQPSPSQAIKILPRALLCPRPCPALPCHQLSGVLSSIPGLLLPAELCRVPTQVSQAAPTQPSKGNVCKTECCFNSMQINNKCNFRHFLERQLGISEVWRAPCWAHTRQAPE